jgi:hypothetical protein
MEVEENNNGDINNDNILVGEEMTACETTTEKETPDKTVVEPFPV